MKRRAHLDTITRVPGHASTVAFFDMITQIIDRLLLAQRQVPWKATGPGDAETDGGTDTTDTTDTTDF